MKNYSKVLIFFAVFMLIFSSCESDKGDNSTTDESAQRQTEAAVIENLNEAVTEYNFTAKEIADTIIAAYSGDEIPQMKNYLSGVTEDSDYYLDPEKAGVILTGKYGAVEAMDYAVDYAFYTPLGHYVFEIDVVRIDDINNKEAVVELLEQRLATKRNGDVNLYNPEEVPKLTDATVIDYANYVILLCTADNTKAVNTVNGVFGGKVELLKNNVPETEEKINGFQITGAADGETVDVPSNVLFDASLLVPEKLSSLPEDQITAAPKVNVKKHSQNEMILLGGRCATGAKIRVTGGLEEILTGSDFGDWLVEVPIPKEGVSVLKLSAKVDGKEWSDEIKFIVKAKTDVTMFEDSGIYATIVGEDYQSVFYDCVPDYEGTNLINDSQQTALQKRVEKKYQEFSERGMTTEIIYLLVPTPMNIYEELMPGRYIRYKENSLTKQFTESVTAGGATVIDLTEVMTAHKYDPFKIYNKTDSHWTEYGAFLGYTELMKYISKEFPDTEPRPESDFRFYNEQVYFGDIYRTLHLEPTALKETSVFCEFKFDSPCGHKDVYDYTSGKSVTLDHEVVGKSQTTNTNLEGNFPSAYIFRDSFGGPIFAFLTDRFSEAKWHKWGQYNYDIKTIEKTNPDYIIYIITERNIRNIMYE